MSIRYFALIMGIAFLLIGILGFIPALVTAPAADEPDLAVHAGHGHLLGLFPVNVVHNLVHVLFGIWGIAAYRSLGGSILYARSVAIIYAVLAILGLLPAPLNTAFGLVPIHGNDIWLHAVIALAAAYFGWLAHPADRASHDAHPTTPPRTV